jgi:hypothetical protein
MNIQTPRIITNEQCEIANLLVENHNDGKSFENKPYFIIEMTGAKQIFFTLYRHNSVALGYSDPYRYICNLSMDLIESVKKTIEYSNLPILLCTPDNDSPLATRFRNRTPEGIPVIPIGKHKGKTLDAVWNEDRNWVIWFSKNYKNPVTSFGNFKMSKADVELLEQANVLIELFFSDMSEKNRETSKSEYIGQPKTRLNLSVRITKIKEKTDDFGSAYTVVYAEDINNNKLYFYDKQYNLSIGQEISFKGTVIKHIEIVGIKHTYFNRVKF